MTVGQMLAHAPTVETNFGSFNGLQKLCKEGRLQDALHAVDVVVQQGNFLPKNVFYCLLRECIHRKDLSAGRKLCACIRRSEFESDAFHSSQLIQMFDLCGSLQEANLLFSDLAEPNIFSWTAVISANSRHGQDEQAINLYRKMHESNVKPDGYVFVAVLKACANAAAITNGMLIHANSINDGFESNTFVANILIDMYAKCGTLEDAFRMFERLPTRDVVTWNSMITGYAQQGNFEGTLHLFNQMRHEGLSPNMVTWNAMIAGYAQHGNEQEALRIFRQMQRDGRKPDHVTFASVLQACSRKAALSQGKLMHAQLIGSSVNLDACLGNTLIDMYIKCGSLDDAYTEFFKLQIRDVVTWSVMIAGYAQHGKSREALHFFKQMQEEGKKPDYVTFVSVLKACSIGAALDQGRVVHSQIVKSGLELNVYIRSILIDMYCNCASLENACRLFDELPQRDLVTWTAMISGYAINSKHELALESFKDMLTESLDPNDVTFVSLLSSCGHLGLVHEGCHHFNSMRLVHGIAPTMEHYNCMVDLLGRAGYLNEAEDIVKIMPFQLNIAGWTSLLSNCRSYGNVVLGRCCFDHVVEENGADASAYLLMSSMYTDAEMWKDADKIQDSRSNADVLKKAGMAFVEVDSNVHDFLVGDESHQQCDDLYFKLRSLALHMKDEGHVPHLGSLLELLPTEDKKTRPKAL